MRLLLDTNILLDTLLARAGSKASSEVVQSCTDFHVGLLAWHGLATIYYVGSRALNPAQARACVEELLGWIEIARAGHEEALRALALEMTDFEDALQAAAAETCGADFIITRNGRDFVNSPILAISPEEFLRRFSAEYKSRIVQND